jgi:hypothetical protein
VNNIVDICNALGLAPTSDVKYIYSKYSCYRMVQTELDGVSCWLVLQEWNHSTKYNDVWILLNNIECLTCWKYTQSIRVTYEESRCVSANLIIGFHRHPSSTAERHTAFRSIGAYRIANVQTCADVVDGFDRADAMLVLLTAMFSC